MVEVSDFFFFFFFRLKIMREGEFGPNLGLQFEPRMPKSNSYDVFVWR